MLGVVKNPTMTAADVAFKAVADEMGVGHTFKMTPVGVYFGESPGVTVARIPTSAASDRSAPGASSAASA